MHYTDYDYHQTSILFNLPKISSIHKRNDHIFTWKILPGYIDCLNLVSVFLPRKNKFKENH